VTELIEHESITTTYPKAKEAQRFAEKLITLAKRDSNAARNRALGILFRPHQLLPKLFGEIRERYAARPGGYTRVLHVEPVKEDQARSAILELVDGPKDMRFAMTAKAIAKEREDGKAMRPLTKSNIEKVTRFRSQGKEELEQMVEKIRGMDIRKESRLKPVVKRKVYPRRQESVYENVRLR